MIKFTKNSVLEGKFTQISIKFGDLMCQFCVCYSNIYMYKHETARNRLIGYLIPYTWNFSWHIYFTVEHETRIFVVEILRMKLSKNFRVFRALLQQGYVRKIYATNLSEIDKTLYQIAYHSRGNPRPPCGKSWESVLSPVGPAIKVYR